MLIPFAIPKLEVVGTADEEVLPRYPFFSADRDVCHLEGLDQRFGLDRPDIDAARMEREQYPWLCWVDLDGFDTLTASKQQFLYCSSHGVVDWD